METNFPTWAYPITFLAAAATTAGTAHFWTKHATTLGLIDQPGQRKIHSHPIPLAGGLALTTGILAPLATALLLLQIPLWNPTLTTLSLHGFNERLIQLSGLISGALAILILGIIDDRTPLSAKTKITFQLLIFTIVTATGTRITLFIPNPFLNSALTILWFLTVVNAFNFTDNMNGLCAGLGFISIFIFALHAALPNHYLVAAFGFLAAGALFGFLGFNFPKAQTFLGDSGSCLVGYLAASLAILPHFYHANQPNKIGVLAPLLILGIVLIDLTWVITYRLWHSRPIYIGDTNHLSHQLVKRGLSPTATVLCLWTIHAALAAISFLLI